AGAATTQGGSDRDADRHVAEVEEDRGRDRGGDGAAILHHGRRGHLRGAGERRQRHHDRGDHAHARVACEDPVGHADHEGGERDRRDVARPGCHTAFHVDGRWCHYDGHYATGMELCPLTWTSS